MKKLFLIICLSAASINAMERDAQNTNPVQTIQQLVSDLESLKTELAVLVESEDMSNAQISAKLPETRKKYHDLTQQFSQFTSSFNAQKALDDGIITPDDVGAALSTIREAQSIILSISFKSIALLQKGQKQEEEEREEKIKQIRDRYANIQTACQVVITVGCCLIIKGLYDLIQK